MKTLILILFLSSTQAFGHINLDGLDVSDIRFQVIRSFDVMNTKSGKIHKIYPRDSVRIRVIGKNSWAYKVRIEVNGIEKPGSYWSAKRYVKKALNLQAAYNTAQLNSMVQVVTNPPNPVCVDGENDTNHQGEQIPVQASETTSIETVTGEEFFEDPEPIVVNNRDWKPGCEVLRNKSNLDAEDKEQFTSLKKCIRSIQNSITRNGTLQDRGSIFRNMYKNLRPEEQHFAAMIFTSHGEAAVLVQDVNGSGKKHHQELMMIMKVVNNRVRNANEDRKRKNQSADANALDVALDPWQFSMYNPNSHGWKRMVQPGYDVNFTDAVKSYMKFQTADIQPNPDVDHIYHYHANYVLPSDSAWGRGFRANHKEWEIAVSVNGDSTRSANENYDESSSSDRSKIGKNWKLWRHRFYRPIDQRGRVTNNDNWHWTVRRPFRS